MQATGDTCPLQQAEKETAILSQKRCQSWLLERPWGSGGISRRGTQNVLGLTQRGTEGMVPRSQKQEEGGRGKSRRGGSSTKQRGGFPQELGRRMAHIPGPRCLGLLLATKQGRAPAVEMDVDVAGWRVGVRK